MLRLGVPNLDTALIVNRRQAFRHAADDGLQQSRLLAARFFGLNQAVGLGSDPSSDNPGKASHREQYQHSDHAHR